MTPAELQARLREIVAEQPPLPAAGDTAQRLQRLAAVAREDLTLAKLAEAHWDAVAILAEAGRTPAPDALYAVWASELPGQALSLKRSARGYTLSGTKPFCSGLGLVNRALVTAGSPVSRLVDLDLHDQTPAVHYDLSVWKTGAFADTQTGSITFSSARLAPDAPVGEPGWYIDRPGFWHGACGPAACWAGGVAGLLDYASRSTRKDPHTLAHLAAMHSNVWAMLTLLDRAGHEIDVAPDDREQAVRRALQLRHMIETLSSDCLRRFARAYGPQPLSMNADIARRYQEADIYLRQSHAERDLEALGRMLASDTAPS